MESTGTQKHEQVSCPRCQQVVECRVGSINICQCQSVTLNEAQRQYIDGQFAGCLCGNCLLAMRTAYNRIEYDRAITKILYGYEPPQ